MRFYPLNWKSEEEGKHLFEEAGVVAFGVGASNGKVYSWLDPVHSTMTPRDKFTNVLLSQAREVQQGSSSSSHTSEGFNTSSFPSMSLLQRVETLQEKL